jgi:hypothetical protein
MAANSFSDIDSDLTRLRERVDGANGIISHLNRAEELLNQAREILARFSDKPAERAFKLASLALDSSRNASCGSLRNFTKGSVELQSRIRNT